jgi:hypothetical protein
MMAGVSRAALFVAGLVLAGCGSTNITARSSPSPGPTFSPGPAFVTITATGITEQVVHVFEERKATFINNDSRPHSIFSDRHPSHEDCGGALNIGTLQPGERREVTGLQVNACFFHDDTDPGAFQYTGVLVIH